MMVSNNGKSCKRNMSDGLGHGSKEIEEKCRDEQDNGRGDAKAESGWGITCRKCRCQCWRMRMRS